MSLLLACLVWFILLITYASVHQPLQYARFHRHKHVYVSMTTMPGRIGSIQPVLDSLLAQSYPITTIFLLLPYYSVKEAQEYQIPSFLAAYAPQVYIIREHIDYGPATKFVPIVKHFMEWGLEDELIIVLDDDQHYPARMVETYVKWDAKLPDASLTLRGHKMLPTLKWAQMPKKNLMQSFELDQVDCVDIVTGVGSFSIKPRFFSSDLWVDMYRRQDDNEVHGAYTGKLKRQVRTADDIWVSGQLAKNGVDRYVLPGRVDPITPETTAQAYADGMIITTWIKRAFVGTHQHELGGGLVQDNEDLMRYFAPYWNCYGQRNTVIPCAQLDLDVYPGHNVLCSNADGNVELEERDWDPVQLYSDEA